LVWNMLYKVEEGRSLSEGTRNGCKGGLRRR
jgi:hypothetical protein